jgi:hypothetical protein
VISAGHDRPKGRCIRRTLCPATRAAIGSTLFRSPGNNRPMQ